MYVSHIWSGYKITWDIIGHYDEVASTRWRRISQKDSKMHLQFLKKHKIDMRKATMVLAVERVLRSI